MSRVASVPLNPPSLTGPTDRCACIKQSGIVSDFPHDTLVNFAVQRKAWSGIPFLWHGKHQQTHTKDYYRQYSPINITVHKIDPMIYDKYEGSFLPIRLCFQSSLSTHFDG